MACRVERRACSDVAMFANNAATVTTEQAQLSRQCCLSQLIAAMSLVSVMDVI